ncbi:hypothetical protein GRI44_07275 [Altererythrobacter confluentis]|uniref:Uncharacterized protein n=1 Tax=Allopontixanthobacter confluentis TaxID=1849021 RepID=A0A6L7GI07_9SPHN|nr:hypothetical protein [Allopontixanthobacter confluentis]MXP14548.1 hypothetical protein [Allopontixanthobacter confluentis]
MTEEEFQDATLLGKKLVEELKRSDDPEVDTLSRWMAHYIAELIVRAESASGFDAEEIRKDCKRTILELWKHRSGFPRSRPFSELEPVSLTLQALQPEEKNPFYRQEVLQKIESEKLEGEIATFLGLALEVDYLARVLISELIDGAVAHAGAENAAWVKAAKPVVEENDNLLELAVWLEDHDSKSERSAGLIRKLQLERLERVSRFIEFVELYRRGLEKNSGLDSIASGHEKDAKKY